MPRVPWVHSVLINLNHRSGNQSAGREKHVVDQMASYLGQAEFSGREKGTFLGGWPGFLSSPVAGHVFELDVFEVDASATKSLMSGTYIIVKKC